MLDAELVQNSPEWLAARAGSIGASEVPDLMRKIKSGGASATRASLMAKKLVERLTGQPVATFQSKAMAEGKAREAEARASYAFLVAPIERIGIIRHPLIKGAHASPDGLVGAHGLVEIKCPEHAAHLDLWLTETVDRDYALQMQWQMACTGRHWCDFVSYHPDFPAALQLYVKTVDRDPELMIEMEGEVQKFIGELERKIETLTDRYHLEAA